MNKILVCLVSRHAMANVIPALYLKPDEVILLSTTAENKTAVNIKNVLKKNGIHCVKYDKFISPFKTDSVTRICGEIIKGNRENSLILYFTGGTKIMSIAAYEEFRKNNLDTLYCDTEHSRLLWLKSSGYSEEKFNVEISVEDYLESYGYHTREDEISEEARYLDFIKFIILNLDEFVEFSLNLRDKIKDLSKINSNKTFHIDNFSVNFSADKIALDYKNTEIAVIDRKDFNFLIGHWLEDYVYYTLQLLKPDDIKKGFKWLSPTETINEVDVLLTKNGRLSLFSCKSLLPKKKLPKETLFEHEGLRNLAGGTYARAFLVANDYNEETQKRAKELNITLISLKNLLTEKINI